MARASAEANRTEVRTVKRDQSRLIKIEEVAEILGVEVRHVRHLVFERRIPFIKWGHLLRFDPDEVAAWIEDHRQRPRKCSMYGAERRPCRPPNPPASCERP